MTTESPFEAVTGHLLDQVLQEVGSVVGRQRTQTSVDYAVMVGTFGVELETGQFQVEPKPAVNAIFEHVREQEFGVLLLYKVATCQQVDQCITTQIVLNWIRLLRPCHET